MALELTENIDDEQRFIAITGDVPEDIEPGYEFRIGDEPFRLQGFVVPQHKLTEADRNRWYVVRGANGTAAGHTAGDSILGAADALVASASGTTPPNPFAAGGGSTPDLNAVLSAGGNAGGQTITNIGAPANPWDAARLQDAGSTPGAVRVISFPFDFTMAAALATGVPVWTPAVGDWLLDAWIQTDDPGWADGDVSAKADIGVVSAGAFTDCGGLFNRSTGPVELSSATWDVGTNLGWYVSNTTQTDLEQAGLIVVTAVGSGAMVQKVRFRSTGPLSLVVSGDGSPSGVAFDGSTGASTLYLQVVTPEES